MGGLQAAGLRPSSHGVSCDLGPACAWPTRAVKPEGVFSPRVVFTQGFPWQEAGSPACEVATLGCVCVCANVFLKGSNLACCLIKIALLERKHCIWKQNFLFKAGQEAKGPRGRMSRVCVCVCVCVCVLNKAMGDAVGWPSPVRVWGWFGRVNAFPQLLVHLGWCLLGSSPVLTLFCPSYQLHQPRVDAIKGWGSPTTKAAVVCLRVEGAATEAGLLLTVARGGVLGTGPALDTFKG